MVADHQLGRDARAKEPRSRVRYAEITLVMISPRMLDGAPHCAAGAKKPATLRKLKIVARPPQAQWLPLQSQDFGTSRRQLWSKKLQL
jgi:hypothetical protein